MPVSKDIVLPKGAKLIQEDSTAVVLPKGAKLIADTPVKKKKRNLQSNPQRLPQALAVV